MRADQKPSAILFKAAEFVERFKQTRRDNIHDQGAMEFGCHAIGLAAHRAGMPNCDSIYLDSYDMQERLPDVWRYFSQFKPEKKGPCAAWFSDDLDHRILALTMAATIAEAEGQ